MLRNTFIYKLRRNHDAFKTNLLKLPIYITFNLDKRANDGHAMLVHIKIKKGAE